MDDLLIAAPTQMEMEQIHASVVPEVQNAGLEIPITKIQEVPPWKYLGWKMTEKTITPQKIQLWCQQPTRFTTAWRTNQLGQACFGNYQ